MDPRRVFSYAICAAGFLLVFATLSSFSQEPNSPVVPGESRPGVSAQETSHRSTTPSGHAAESYVLQRGDDLEVRSYNNAELAQIVKIRPDGKISLVLLDDVDAAGLTPAQLGKFLSEAYAKHIRKPVITVIVRSFSNLTVYVGGEVVAPKLLPLTGRLTVTGAVISAGGLKPTAKLRDIILLSDSGKGSPIITRLNLDDVLRKGKPDVELKPFDVVYVPKTKIAKADQFVDQWMKQLLPVNLGLGFSYLLGTHPLIQ